MKIKPTYNNFSIIIPTYNRADFLVNTLEKLLEIEYPTSHFEIIVVNNNSTDKTALLLKKFKSKIRSGNFQILEEKRQGRTFASIQGMEHAKFSKIVFLDDDILFSKNFLQIYNTLYIKFPKAAIIGGKIEAILEGNQSNIMDFIRERYDSWIFGEVDYGIKTRALTYPESLFAGNFSLNLKEISESPFYKLLGRKIGNYYLYGEDFHLCLRLLLQKKQIIYSPELNMKNIVTQGRITTKALIKRYFCGGIERYLIDKNLSSQMNEYVKIKIERSSIRSHIVKSLRMLKKKKIKFLLYEYIFELTYDIGYKSGRFIYFFL